MLTRTRFAATSVFFVVATLFDLAAMRWGWHPLDRAVGAMGFFQSNGFEGEMKPWWISQVADFGALAVPVLAAVLALLGISASFRPGTRPAVAPALRYVVSAWVALGLLVPVMLLFPDDTVRQAPLEFMTNHASWFVPLWWVSHFLPPVLLKLAPRDLARPALAYVVFWALLLGAVRVFAGG